ncbi:MAG: hypothetical protein J6V69_00285, partial [Clostridia bacterium]|nr:hypothetical protein [Clostridia bacterium]
MYNKYIKKAVSVLLVVTLLTIGAFFLLGCDKNSSEDGETNMSNIATFVITDQAGVDRLVKIQLHPDKDPLSVENFTNLANSGYYD